MLTARLSADTFRNDELVEPLGRLLTEEVQVGPLLSRLTGAQIDLLRQAEPSGRWPRPASLELSREWRQRFRSALENDSRTKGDSENLLADVIDTYSAKGGSLFFATATLEFHGRASLSWYLTPEEKQRLRAEVDSDEMAARMERIVEWWMGRPRNRPVGR
jgi:hypothetical protein